MKSFPPSPKGHWLLGHAPAFKNDPLNLLLNSHKTLGDVFSLKFGPTKCYVLIHPDHVRHVLQTHAENYDTQFHAHNYLREVFGDGLLTSEGPSWKKQRQTAQNELHYNKIVKLAPPMIEAIEETLKRWDVFCKQEKIFNLHIEMNRLAIRVLDKTLFGVNLSEEEIDLIRLSMLNVSQSLLKRTRSFINLPLWIPSENNLRLNKFSRNLRDITQKILTTYQNGGGIKDGLIDHITKGDTLKNNDNLCHRKIIDQLLTFLVTGYATTAITMTWTFYLLNQHKDIEKKLQSEINSSLGQGLTNYEDLKKLRYLEQILKESLRLYTPVWRIIRRSIKKDQIGPYTIPSNSLIMVSPYVTHRHPQFWDNPEAFQPHRFDPSNKNNIYPSAYFPFGMGPRSCVGYHLATMEAQLAIAMIKRKFKLKFLSQNCIKPDPLLGLPPKQPIMVSLAKS